MEHAGVLIKKRVRDLFLHVINIHYELKINVISNAK